MKIIPAGKYESALVRLVDSVVMPNRNLTGHRYYMDLNRRVDRSLADGVATFVALAEETIVPWELDWIDLNDRVGDDRIEIAVRRSRRRDHTVDVDKKIYKEISELTEQICALKIISDQSNEYITNLDLQDYPIEIIDYWNKKLNESKESILSSYVRRVLTQIYTAPDFDGCYIVASERDIQIMAEIGAAIVEGRVTTNLPFPDLRNRLLDPYAFAHGILNFSPKDIRAVEKVRADTQVQQYARRIQGLLKQSPIGPDDPAITDALVDAYYRSEAGKKAKSVFEIGTWLVKPLHYIPVIGEVISVAEDIKDIVQKAADVKLRQQEWFFVGIRMQEIAITSYLESLSDNRHPMLRDYRDSGHGA